MIWILYLFLNWPEDFCHRQNTWGPCVLRPRVNWRHTALGLTQQREIVVSQKSQEYLDGGWWWCWIQNTYGRYVKRYAERINMSRRAKYIARKETPACFFPYQQVFTEFFGISGVCLVSLLVVCLSLAKLREPFEGYGMLPRYPHLYTCPRKTNMAFPCKKTQCVVDWKTFEPGPRYLFIPLLLMLFFWAESLKFLGMWWLYIPRDAQDPQVAGKTMMMDKSHTFKKTSHRIIYRIHVWYIYLLKLVDLYGKCR